MVSRWKPRAVGDILWCHFAELPELDPGPKPRPALVVQVSAKDDGTVVAVVYGTSQRLGRLLSGEFAIRKAQNPAAFTLAGLSFDTKFNFKQIVELPWTDPFLKVPPKAAHGQNPKLGTLHPSMMQAARAAYLAARGA
jgi:mRNA-degrading endonuclease toxin of MazEF toxin-antitoxin module